MLQLALASAAERCFIDLMCDWMSFAPPCLWTLFGLCHYRTSLIFDGNGWIPSPLISCPRRVSLLVLRIIEGSFFVHCLPGLYDFFPAGKVSILFGLMWVFAVLLIVVELTALVTHQYSNWASSGGFGMARVRGMGLFRLILIITCIIPFLWFRGKWARLPI